MIDISKILEYESRCSRMNLLLEIIKDISDLDYQKRAWIDRSIPNNVDCWDECICGFFDDCDIDHFLATITPKSNPEFGLSQQHIDALWEFRNILRVYSSDMYELLEKRWKNSADPRDIIADPRWHQVVACAQETLKAFEGYRVPTDEELLD